MSKSQLAKNNMFAARGQEKNEEETRNTYQKVKDLASAYKAIIDKCSIPDIGFDEIAEKLGTKGGDSRKDITLGAGVVLSFLGAYGAINFSSPPISHRFSFQGLIPMILFGTSSAKRNLPKKSFSGSRFFLLASSYALLFIGIGVFGVAYTRSRYGVGRHNKVDQDSGVELTPVSRENPLDLVSVFPKKEASLYSGSEQLKKLEKAFTQLLEEDVSPEAKVHISKICEKIKTQEKLHQEALSSMEGFLDLLTSAMSLVSENFSKKAVQLQSARLKNEALMAKNQRLLFEKKDSESKHEVKYKALVSKCHRLLSDKQDSESKHIAKHKGLEKKYEKLKETYNMLKNKCDKLAENESFLQGEIEFLGNKILEGSGNFSPRV